MPDVGVLNLQIHDDSGIAAEGLDNLATKLEAVKQAVHGMSLGSVANGLKKINEALGQIDTTAVSKLNAITAALERMSNAAGNVGGIRVSFGANRTQALEGIQGQAQAAREATADATAAMQEMKSSVQETSAMEEELAQSINRVQQAAQLDFSKFDPSNLPLNALGMKFDESAQEAYHWRDAVRDSFEEVNRMRGGQLPFDIAGGGAMQEAQQEAARAIEDNTQLIQVESAVQEAVEQGVQQTNDALRETLRIRRDINSAVSEEEQREYARQERNYPNYRVAYLDGDDQTKQMVLNMSRLSPGALEQAETYAEALKITMQEVNEYVDRFIDNMNTPTGPLLRDTIDEAMASRLAMKNAARSAAVLKNAPEIRDETEEVQSSVQTMSRSMEGAIRPTTMLTESMEDLDRELKQKKNDLNSVGSETKSLGQRFSDLMFGAEGLRGAFGRMFPTISGLLKRFGQLVKYRMLRAVIKQIAEGFKEGYENYYRYSEAIGSDFAPAMDSAATALLQMKNSIGAAVAPLLQSLVPILQTVVDWFINLVNYANQFFALMRGQTTWSMAQKKTTKMFDEQTKKTKQTSKAMKDLLADWDELNIIQSESGGGGGGTGLGETQTYVEMFTEVSKFNEQIKRFVEGIKKHFGSISDLVKKIAIGILGWKLSSAFTGLLGSLGGLIATGVVIDLLFNISAMFNENYLNTGEKGWLVADLLTTLLGGVLMKKILGKVLGGTLAKLAMPIALTVSATAGVKMLLGNTDVSALSEEALTDAAYNALKFGGAAGLLLYNFGGVGAAASLGGGVGTAIATFGLLIGLKATADTLQTREFTDEIVKADFLSAGLVGTGIALTELFLGGTAVTALTLGGGAALITLGALFAVQAILTLKEQNPITWGSYKATEEEVKAYIDEYVFEGAPKAKLSLVNASFEELGTKKKDLEASAAAVLGTLQSVKLGLVSSASSDLEGEVATMLANFRATSQEYQEGLQLAINLVPMGNGNEEGEAMIKRSGERWNELDGIMTQLANDLTKQFGIAYDSSLSEETRKDAEIAIEKISGMMTQVADAISSGQAKAKVAHALDMQMSNLSHETMDEMLNYYKEQRDQLIEELTKATQDSAEGHLAQSYAFEQLAAYALKEAGGDTTDATYQHYLAQQQAAYNDYLEMIEGARERAEAEVDRTLGKTKGVQSMRETLIGNLEGLSLGDDVEMIIAEAIGGDPELYAKAWQTRLMQAMESQDNAEVEKEMSDLMYWLLYNLVGGDNVDTYMKALDEGVLQYADLFDNTLLAQIADQLGITDTEGARKLWNEVVSQMFGESFAQEPQIPEVAGQAQEAAEEVSEELNEALEGEQVEAEVPVHFSLKTWIDDAKQAIGEFFAMPDWVQEAQEKAQEMTPGTEMETPTYDYVIEEDPSLEEPMSVPAVDSSAFVESTDAMAAGAASAVDDIRRSFSMLDGLTVTLGTSVWDSSGGGGGMKWTAQTRAGGGYVRSGDLVMANENGNFEMMGRMGHQPVVANNDQIVTGITRGVAEGNDSVVSALNAVVTLMQRLEQKEIVARVTPSSAMGRNNQQSAEAFSRVTG